MRTTCRSKPRRTRHTQPLRRGTGPADPATPVRWYSRGAKLRAAGMGLAADPLEASEARSVAGAKA